MQHITRSRNRDRVHTSTASVVVYRPPINNHQGISERELREEFFRASGPGGQHRNKTDTAVKLTHLPTGITATATERSQAENRKKARAALTAKVASLHSEQRAENTRAQRRKQVGNATRVVTGRTYDCVRDWVRSKDGQKVRGVDRVLAGDLSDFTR